MSLKNLIFNRAVDLIFSASMIGLAVSYSGRIAILAGLAFFAWQGLVVIATLVANPLTGQYGVPALISRCMFVGLVSLGFVPAMFAAQRDIERDEAAAYSKANPPKPFEDWAFQVRQPENTCYGFAKWKKANPAVKDLDWCQEFAANHDKWRAKTVLLLEQRGFHDDADFLSGRTHAAIEEVKAHPEKCEIYAAMTKEKKEKSAIIRAADFQCSYQASQALAADTTASTDPVTSSSSLWK